MEAKLLEEPAGPKSFTSGIARGEWPAAASDLPLVLNQHQLAHLRGVTLRTLQLGCSIPFVRDGKKVLYARAHVLTRYGAAQAA
jgi:hypothetical protein